MVINSIMADLLFFRTVWGGCNGKSMPFTACMKTIKDVIENLVQRKITFKPSFCGRYLGTNILIELFFNRLFGIVLILDLLDNASLALMKHYLFSFEKFQSVHK